MRGELVRQKFHNGDCVYITHVVSLGNPIHAVINATLEVDAIFICTEHMPIDRTEVSMMCQFYALNGISPMVRISHPCAREAAKYVDGGAQGIVVPYVETIDEVKAVVGAVKYRPIKGEQLQKYMDGEEPNDKMKAFFNRFNRDNYVIIGIESVAAIRRLEELVTIKGVDAVFLGPHDITCSMGIPEEYEHPDFVRTVVNVIKRCRKAGVSVGIQMDLTNPNTKPFLDAGMNFIFHLADVVKMRNVMNKEFTSLRARAGDVYDKQGSGIVPTAACINVK